MTCFQVLEKNNNTYTLTLCDELGRVELGHDALEDLVADGRQHPLVIVSAELARNLGQLALLWPEQHTQRDVHSL